MAITSMTLLRPTRVGEAEVIHRGILVSKVTAFATVENEERVATGNEASFLAPNRNDIENGWRLLDRYGEQWEVVGSVRPQSPGGRLQLDARRVKSLRIASGSDPFAGFDVLALNDNVIVNNDVAIGIPE